MQYSGCRNMMDQQNTSRTRGVITVLFLFVVAFIFAAISLSMQMGQIVERRIVADQAADSATVAMASKSAQGLNFIAANNLAIAGASHMAGVFHLAADRIVLLRTYFTAKSLFEGGSPVPDDEDVKKYQAPYDWFKTVVQLYFRSAIGMTRLNYVIQTFFPFLGTLDAISVGSANAPDSLVLPFSWTPPTSPAAGSNGSSFKSTIVTRLKQQVSTLLPKYNGLSKLNSDETFCLAYLAGSKGVNDEKTYNQLEPWLSNVQFPILAKLNDILKGAAKVFDGLSLIQGWFSIKVGFDGCGFGEKGDDLAPVNPAVAMNQIGQYLYAVLKGPLSGRPIKASFSDPASRTIQPILWDQKQLEDKTNEKFKEVCNDSPVKWSTEPVGVERQLLQGGACLSSQIGMHKYKRGRKNPYESSAKYTPGDHLEPDDLDLYDYKAVCLGTILYQWEGYSGLLVTYNSINPNNSTKIAAPQSPPGIALDNTESDLCPAFQASKTNTSIMFPEYNGGPSYVNLSRSNSFVSPILNGLINPNSITTRPAHWRGADPRPGAIKSINHMLDCAQKNEKCPGGYLENKDHEKYYPELDRLDWLCPAAAEGDATANNIRQTLKFDNPLDDSRWSNSRFDITLPGNRPQTFNYSRYVAMQELHNERVDELVDHMNCANYEAFIKKGLLATDNGATSNADSNNYCAEGAHYCWQKAMQDYTATKDEIKKGPLSFLVSTEAATQGDETPLEKSLHYAVLAVNPLRTDNGGDIIGSNSTDPKLAHCPKDMEITVTLEDNTQVQVCDVQPVIGFISRMVSNGGANSALAGDTNIGGGDANLASGGAIGASNTGLFGAQGFMAIAQSAARFEEKAKGAPAKPTAPISKAKNYQLFWPSWHPIIEPSRVMSGIMPAEIAPLVED